MFVHRACILDALFLTKTAPKVLRSPNLIESLRKLAEKSKGQKGESHGGTESF